MGKRGKNLGKHQQQPESEQEEEQQEENEEQIQEQDIEDQEQSEDDSAIVMEKINQKLDQVQDGQKLAWAALVTLYNQKKQLLQAMDKQIEQIQKKYHDLQVPIVEKISKAIAGEALQKTVYENEKTKGININKVKPKPIEDYWLNIIEKSRLSGLLVHEQDKEVLKKCTKVISTIHDNGEQTHITLTMHFKENPYFKNHILQLQLKQEADNTLVRKVIYPIQYKTEKREQSFFTFIFQNDNLDDMLLQMLLDFHNSYMNSLKVYFLGQTEFNEQQDNQEDDDQQDQQSQQFQGKKPNKKVKGDPLQKKPECNQQ